MSSNTFIMYCDFLWRKTKGGRTMEQKYNDNWINIDKAAEYLGIKPVTLRGWIKKDSSLPAQKIGKQWKFKKSELDEWVKSGKSAM